MISLAHNHPPGAAPRSRPVTRAALPDPRTRAGGHTPNPAGQPSFAQLPSSHTPLASRSPPQPRREGRLQTPPPSPQTPPAPVPAPPRGWRRRPPRTPECGAQAGRARSHCGALRGQRRCSRWRGAARPAPPRLARILPSHRRRSPAPAPPPPPGRAAPEARPAASSNGRRRRHTRGGAPGDAAERVRARRRGWVRGMARGGRGPMAAPRCQRVGGQRAEEGLCPIARQKGRRQLELGGEGCPISWRSRSRERRRKMS